MVDEGEGETGLGNSRVEVGNNKQASPENQTYGWFIGMQSGAVSISMVVFFFSYRVQKQWCDVMLGRERVSNAASKLHERPLGGRLGTSLLSFRPEVYSRR